MWSELVVCMLATLLAEVVAAKSSGHFLESRNHIETMDTNNSKPTFSQKVFTGTVPELSAPDTAVMTVSATKPATFNAALRYSITSQEHFPATDMHMSIFGIGEKTGVIHTTEAVPPLEVVKAFRLSLEVADGTGLTDEAVAMINVTDINNHAPEFSPTSYHLTTVKETIGDIGRVSVTDGDEPGTGNWEAKYSISGDPHGYFSIRTDAETNQGILSVVKSFNDETLEEHRLTLCVKNINPLVGESWSIPESTATVTIAVVDGTTAPYTEDPIQMAAPQNERAAASLNSNTTPVAEEFSAGSEITLDPRNWQDISNNTGVSPRIPRAKNKVCTVEITVTALNGKDSTSATVQISTAETNVFAPQLWPSGLICKTGELFFSGLAPSSEDGDLPPLAAPYSFDSPWVLSNDKWILTQVNDTHAVLQPGVGIDSGVYEVTVIVSESGAHLSSARVNLTLCACNSFGACQSAVTLDFHLGSGLIAFIIVVVIIAIIPLVILGVELLNVLKQCHNKRKCREADEPEGHAHENANNCGEQVCREEDTNTVNPNLLSKLHDATNNFDGVCNNPSGEPQIISGGAHSLPAPTTPCKTLDEIEDCIHKRLETAENDLDVPPYDIALIYNYEEDDSLHGSLSSIFSSVSDADQDYDYLSDWKPQSTAVDNLSDKAKGDKANESS
ncbi:cadherin-15-like isoform 1-T2 [Synchiropus picturatus]